MWLHYELGSTIPPLCCVLTLGTWLVSFLFVLLFCLSVVVTKSVPGEHVVEHVWPVCSGDPGSDDSFRFSSMEKRKE